MSGKQAYVMTCVLAAAILGPTLSIYGPALTLQASSVATLGYLTTFVASTGFAVSANIIALGVYALWKECNCPLWTFNLHIVLQIVSMMLLEFLALIVYGWNVPTAAMLTDQRATLAVAALVPIIIFNYVLLPFHLFIRPCGPICNLEVVNAA